MEEKRKKRVSKRTINYKAFGIVTVGVLYIVVTMAMWTPIIRGYPKFFLTDGKPEAAIYFSALVIGTFNQVIIGIVLVGLYFLFDRVFFPRRIKEVL